MVVYMNGTGVSSRPEPSVTPRSSGGERQKRGSELGTAVLVVVALLLVVAAVAYLPQPRIRLTSVEYATGPCDLATATVVATAFVTLANDGAGDGDIFVRFFIDSERKATGHVFVLAQSSIHNSVSATVMVVSFTDTRSTRAFRWANPPPPASHLGRWFDPLISNNP